LTAAGVKGERQNEKKNGKDDENLIAKKTKQKN